MVLITTGDEPTLENPCWLSVRGCLPFDIDSFADRRGMLKHVKLES